MKNKDIFNPDTMLLFQQHLGNYFATTYPDLAALNAAVKVQNLAFEHIDQLAIGLRASVWTNILMKYVIKLKGGGVKIIEAKALYPTLNIPFRDKPRVIKWSISTKSPNDLKIDADWSKHDFSGYFETIEGVEEVMDNSLELELRDLKDKYAQLQEDYKDLERHNEFLREEIKRLKSE
jgi:hypothetical protein